MYSDASTRNRSSSSISDSSMTTSTQIELLMSVCTFGATTLFVTLWKQRQWSLLLFHKTNNNKNTTTTTTNDSTVASSRLVHYLSSQYSDWTDYSDHDENLIRDMPKIELHVHLDGSFDPHCLWNYIQEHPTALLRLPTSITPPWLQAESSSKLLFIRSQVQDCTNEREYHNLCTCRGYRSLSAMLNCFEMFLPLVRGNLDLLEYLAYDFCQRQYEQNVIYTEVRYSPHLLAEAMAHEEVDPPSTTTNNDKIETNPKNVVSAEDVLLAVTRGLRHGCQEFDISVSQILCAICWRPDWAQSTLDLAERYRNNTPCPVFGVDIAAGEEHFDPKSDLYLSHYEMAQMAQQRNIPMTLHAGESTSHALDNVRRAVLEYGAARIGHGYRMVDDPDIMKLVQDHNVHVEVCLTSSDETGGWVYDTKNWKEHPSLTMLQNGMSVSLSSDDPAVFHTSLAWQYRMALAKLDLTAGDLIRMNLKAVDAAFCNEMEKERLRQMIHLYAKENAHLDGMEDFKDIQVNEKVLRQNPRVLLKSKTDSFSDRVYLNAHEYI